MVSPATMLTTYQWQLSSSDRRGVASENYRKQSYVQKAENGQLLLNAMPKRLVACSADAFRRGFAIRVQHHCNTLFEASEQMQRLISQMQFPISRLTKTHCLQPSLQIDEPMTMQASSRWPSTKSRCHEPPLQQEAMPSQGLQAASERRPTCEEWTRPLDL